MMITDLLKTSWNYFLIFWNMKIYLRWDQYNFFSLEGDRTKQPNWLVPFCLKRIWPFVYIIICGRLGMTVGKLHFILVAIDNHFYDLSRFNLYILLLGFQKEPQEDWRGGEDGTADNIGGGEESIPLSSHRAQKSILPQIPPIIIFSLLPWILPEGGNIWITYM